MTELGNNLTSTIRTVIVLSEFSIWSRLTVSLILPDDPDTKETKERCQLESQISTVPSNRDPHPGLKQTVYVMQPGDDSGPPVMTMRHR